MIKVVFISPDAKETQTIEFHFKHQAITYLFANGYVPHEDHYRNPYIGWTAEIHKTEEIH